MTAQTILPANSVTGGYEVSNSLRFDSAAGTYLNFDQATATSARKMTFSTWLKLSKLNDYNILLENQANPHNSQIVIQNNGNNNDLRFYDYDGSTNIDLRTSRAFRDVSAWYHIVVAMDTTQSTASNRVKIYINGVQETALDTATYPDQNYDTAITGGTLQIGRQGTTSYHIDGYLAETVFIDGSQLAADSFGEFDEDSGIWKPIDGLADLTFGNNGFYLDYKDSSALGNDAAGSNNLTTNNINAVDQSTDTCTNNFATLNRLNSTLTNTVLSEGNLKLVGGRQSANYTYITGTIAVSSGKWYWEVKAVDNSEIDQVGVAKMDLAQFAGIATSTGLQGAAYGGRGVQMSNGNKVGDGSQGAHMGGFSANNICMVALDLDNNKITFGRNGLWSNGSGGADQAFGDATAAYTDLTAGAMYVPAQTMRDSGNNNPGTMEYNFGNAPYAISSGNADANGHGNFEYAVPSGYFALNTQNLAEHG